LPSKVSNERLGSVEERKAPPPTTRTLRKGDRLMNGGRKPKKAMRSSSEKRLQRIKADSTKIIEQEGISLRKGTQGRHKV